MPGLQEAVNQPISTLSQGDLVLCYETFKRGVEGNTHYAIKVATSSTFGLKEAHAFLMAYKEARKSFLGTLMEADAEARSAVESVVTCRNRKAKVQALVSRRKRVAQDLAKIDAELSEKRARV